MAFIEKLDGPALNLSPKDFERYMLKQRAPPVGEQRLKVASVTQHLLEELKDRQEKLDKGVDFLNMQLQKWAETVHSQLDDATAQFALVQKEIQSQCSQVPLPSSHGASSQEDEKGQFVQDHPDQCAGPEDTDC